ncbi:MAG: hypothetical protein U5R31_03350 [Acidimicrobiia bacterium]|nr:hypothetical protein [Acidimicrobiia bacterium]
MPAPTDFLGPRRCAAVVPRGAEGHSAPGFDTAWRDRLVATWRDRVASPLVDGGVYAETSGPAFETPAEVRLLAAHADLAGTDPHTRHRPVTRRRGSPTPPCARW